MGIWYGDLHAASYPVCPSSFYSKRAQREPQKAAENPEGTRVVARV